MVDHPDLSYVDPRRLAETKRRVAIVRKYVAIERPTGVEAKRYAGALGMSTSNFSRLVKAWREQGRLPGGEATERRSRAASESKRGIPADTRRIVKETIDAAGASARFSDVLKMARAACAGRGVKCPSQGSIWNMVQKRPRKVNPAAPEATSAILIVRCGLDLKVKSGGTIGMAQALLAVALPSGRIVTAEPLLPPPARPPAFPDLVASLVRRFGGAVEGVTVLADDDAVGRDGTVAAPGAVAIERPPAGSLNMLRAAIGPKLDTIALASSSRTRAPARFDNKAPLDRAEARDAIAHAVARHNAGLPDIDDLRVRLLPVANPKPK